MADLNDIINTLIAEANAEGPEGMRRVAETILNRAAIRGLTPAEVVRQPNQYTGYYAPGPAAVQAQQMPEVRSAAQAAWDLAMQPGDPTNGADHYKANYVNPYWADKMPSTGSYGDHDFYKSTDVPTEALARLLTPRTAPVPQMPPARGNVPSDLIGQSFDALPKQQTSGLSPSTIKSISDMFSEPVRDATPRLNRDGSVTDPAEIVFGKQMATDILPNTRRKVSASDLARGNSGISTIASIPTRPQISPSDLARGNSGISTIATIPTTGVGAPPTTRSVASVPVRPQTSASDRVRGKSAPATPQAAIAEMFGPPGPAGYTNGAKSQERLAPGVDAYAPALFGGIDPALARIPGQPRPASEAAIARQPKKVAPTPAVRSITETVENPDWTASLKTSQVPRGMPVNFGSRDTVARRAAGVTAAQAVPQFITRTRQVPMSAPAPSRPRSVAQAPLKIVVQGGNTGGSAVDQLRAQGLSPSQAYDMANANAAQRARENASNPSHQSSSSWFNEVTGR